ncbi:protein Skeletor, isoforms B/C isoform X2 [Zeugodacus cucurbitae]|nr:protein Skeletor, isoforms B/C isoform X2 [Zeugodacus cucurbitae]
MAPLMQILLKALIGLICCRINTQVGASFPYYGTKIGALTRLHHGVSGDVYAVDSRTLFIKNFNYDGEAPAAYFYVGNTAKPSNDGAQRLRDERGGVTALSRRYRNKDITLPLPDGKTLRDFKWFSVWCDEFAVNFGHVSIPADLDFPRPQKIASLKGVHAVSSENIVIVDAQTLLIPNFSYDGEAPDAKFWVGRGQRPSPQGLRIPDENGKEIPLRRYDRKTIVLTLPDDLTIFDIGHFGVWCEAFTVDFGHVRIPEGLNVPPSLKMLGISPQSRLNCEVLYDDLAFEVRWAVAGDSIVIQLIAKLDRNEYMSFGVSKSREESKMIGSDVVVAWVEKDTGKGFAVDYYLSDKSQCSGGLGVCPKVNIENGTNSIRLLNAAWVNGYSIVTYQRSLQSNSILDVPILVNLSQAIVWGIGPLNERNEASYHTYFTRYSTQIDFGRQPIWNCPSPEGSKADRESDDNNHQTDFQTYSAYTHNNTQSEEFYDNRPQALLSTSMRQAMRPLQQARPQHQHQIPTPKPTSTNGAWDIPAIQCYEPEDGVFYAQMGPTGGKHGYSAITGHVGWGISWYINGLLIPEINVVRGKTYTFVVEGGIDADIPAKYHPFYITDDSVGGYEHKREEEKKSVRIFAGVHRTRSGQVTPTGVGRLCNWTPDVDGPPADDYQSFGAYQRTLTLKCDPGEPGVITWTPDRNTPDTVYYQCFTHRYLGWKIHVHDSCDDSEFSASASEKHEDLTPHFDPADADAEASIRHETKVSPNDKFLLMHQTNLIKNHNMNGTPPKLSFEITKSSEITKLISDGIRAAEALEESILKNTNAYNTNVNITTIQKIKYNNTEDSMEPTNMQHQQQSYMKSIASIKKNTVGTISLAESPQGRLPLEPIISSAVPEILRGENHINMNQKNSQIFLETSSKKALSSTSSISHNHHSQHTQSHNHLYNLTNIPAQKPIGLSEFLRPPQNAGLLNAVKLPGRRPFFRPIKKIQSTKPVLPYLPQRTPQISLQPVPQPSVIVSHYPASVLLLGEPTTLNEHRKNEPTLVQLKSNTNIPVPYSDAVPQEANATIIFANNEYHANSDKDDFDSGTKINNGFQPNSVVIESGFRPIIRTDGHPQHHIINQIALRREDPGSEIDEVMQTDTLFLTAQKVTQTQNFEPMFIPSPPDSTNVTIILQNVVSSSPTSNRNEFRSNLSEKYPNTAKLRNSTTEDVFSEVVVENLDGDATNNLEEAATKITTKNDKTGKDSLSTQGNHSLLLEDIMSEMEQIDDENDREAQAAERIDTYYLPPDNRKIPHSSLPSGAVVTFDGKSIVDGNLVLPPKLETFEDTNPRRQAHGLSQIEQLIRSTPQVQPFRGEIPQPVVEFLSNERSRNRAIGTGGGGMVGAVGHENPGPYLPLTSLSPPRVHSTKLQLLHSSTYRQ